MKKNIDIIKLRGFNTNVLNPSKIRFQSDSRVSPLSSAMSLQEAVQLMNTSTTIGQWNTNRERVKENVGVEAFLHCGYHQAIDGSGMISRLKLQQKVNSNVKIYKPFNSRTNGK